MGGNTWNGGYKIMPDQLPEEVLAGIQLVLLINPSNTYRSGDMERFFRVVGYLASNNNDSNKCLLLSLSGFAGTLYEIKERKYKITNIIRDHTLAKYKESMFLEDKWFQVEFLKKKHIPEYLKLKQEITELTAQLDKQRGEILAMVEAME